MHGEFEEPQLAVLTAGVDDLATEALGDAAQARGVLNFVGGGGAAADASAVAERTPGNSAGRVAFALFGKPRTSGSSAAGSTNASSDRSPSNGDEYSQYEC